MTFARGEQKFSCGHGHVTMFIMWKPHNPALRHALKDTRIIDFDYHFDQFARRNIELIFVNERLGKYCTWGIGGWARLLVVPSSIEQLAWLRRYASAHEVPSLVIGGGANLLFDDGVINAILIKLGRSLSAFSIHGNRVCSGAATAVPRLARAAGLARLSGLEHTIGIPGTIGGLIAMNGGSQRKAIGEVVTVVEAMDSEGCLYELSRKECGFSYRQSVFQGSDLLVVSAEIELNYADPQVIQKEMLGILRERRRKFPLTWPNCGSVFSSSPEMFTTVGPPGKLIEQAGLKGTRIGDAEISRRHANFIINRGYATASNVIQLIQLVRRKVHERTGVWMECEVQFVSADGRVRRAHEIENSSSYAGNTASVKVE